ncbi:hypothetical protein F4678DRAFT_477921 [Xylaria arbuscula]|nr:hypothetical protein F4678DRAFT_477921 [Xylaria arbuscula]
MVLSALPSTYQLYKRDTDAVAGWLASTAKSLGFATDVTATTSASKPVAGGRLKGKARAEAKKQGAAAPKQSSPATGPKYIIDIKDFVPLAEYVAGKVTSVPETFRVTIDRVIAMRSGFRGRLEKYGKEISEISDAKHQNSIEGALVQVLENVREALEHLMPAPDTNQNAPIDEKLSNRFAGLTSYEPVLEFLAPPIMERPAKTENDTAVYEAETETSFEHAAFALTSVINDMNRVRAHVRWIWFKYKMGEFDLAAAAIATNTAIDLIRNTMEDILPLLDRNGGLRHMLKKLHILQCLMHGWNIEDIFTGGPDNLNYGTYDVGCDTYFIIYRLLEVFIAALQPGRLPIYEEGLFGYYDPASDRSRKTGFQKFADDRALLMPFFTEQMTTIIGLRDWPIKDEFLRGMEELVRTRTVPFYTVFAAQVFLDITYELGEDIERGFGTMIDHATQVENDIKLHFEFHAELKINTWPATKDLLIQGLQRSIQEIGKDPLRTTQAKVYEKQGVIMPDIKSHRLFRMSPVISGLFLYHFRSRYREIGLAVAGCWGSIQYCEHLYNALSHEHLVCHTWLDMLVLKKIIGDDSFYVGGQVPETPHAYFNKFCLQMGTSAAAMTKKRRKNTPLQSGAGPRSLKAESPVLSMFKARYVDNTGQVDFTPEHVGQIIELNLFRTDDSQGRLLMMGCIKDPKFLEKNKMLEQKMEGKRKEARSGNMPLEQLIKPLVNSLHAESLQFSYPYMMMHRLCWGVLRRIKDSCDACLRQLYTPAYLEKESQLPWIVGWILMAASGLEGVSDRRPLQLAAKAMKEFLNSGGGQCDLLNTRADRNPH